MTSPGRICRRPAEAERPDHAAEKHPPCLQHPANTWPCRTPKVGRIFRSPVLPAFRPGNTASRPPCLPSRLDRSRPQPHPRQQGRGECLRPPGSPAHSGMRATCSRSKSPTPIASRKEGSLHIPATGLLTESARSPSILADFASAEGISRLQPAFSAGQKATSRSSRQL